MCAGHRSPTLSLSLWRTGIVVKAQLPFPVSTGSALDSRKQQGGERKQNGTPNKSQENCFGAEKKELSIRVSAVPTAAAAAAATSFFYIFCSDFYSGSKKSKEKPV